MAVRPGTAKRHDRFGTRESPWENDVKYMDAAVHWLRTGGPGMDRPWILAMSTHMGGGTHTSGEHRRLPAHYVPCLRHVDAAEPEESAFLLGRHLGEHGNAEVRGRQVLELG